MVREIPLTRGFAALVDDSDYEFLTQFKWSVVTHSDGENPYARHGMQVTGKFYAVAMHRLILAAPDAVEVDHWNGNGLDNRRENLRLCNRFQNAQNVPKRGVGFKGTIKFEHSWLAQIMANGDHYSLGRYRSAKRAAQVYDAAARRLHGEFAATNFPEIDEAADEIVVTILAGGKPPTPERVVRILSDDDVRGIRLAYAAGGIKIADLSAHYGVCKSSVSHILTGRTYRHIHDDLSDSIRAIARNARGAHLPLIIRKLSDEQVRELRSRYSPRVVTAGALAKEFNVSISCIYSVVNGHSHKDFWAAMPVAAASAARPPSSAATRSSSAATVGLEIRE